MRRDAERRTRGSPRRAWGPGGPRRKVFACDSLFLPVRRLAAPQGQVAQMRRGRRLDAGLHRGVRRLAGTHALHPVRQMQQFTLRLDLEVHPLDQRVKSRIGAQRVEDRIDPDSTQPFLAIRDRPFQPGERLVPVPQADIDERLAIRRNVTLRANSVSVRGSRGPSPADRKRHRHGPGCRASPSCPEASWPSQTRRGPRHSCPARGGPAQVAMREPEVRVGLEHLAELQDGLVIPAGKQEAVPAEVYTRHRRQRVQLLGRRKAAIASAWRPRQARHLPYCRCVSASFGFNSRACRKASSPRPGPIRIPSERWPAPFGPRPAKGPARGPGTRRPSPWEHAMVGEAYPHTLSTW